MFDTYCKKIGLLILAVFVAVFDVESANAGALEICAESVAKISGWMKQGVYRGLSPTDEGALAIGEFQVTITDSEMIAKMATGLKIEEFRTKLSELVPLTEEEMIEEFKEGSTAYKDWVGFKRRDFSAPRFLIPKKAAWLGPRVFVKMGDLADTLGPTVLYSPLQGKLGITSLNFGITELLYRSQRSPDSVMIPRLKYNGTADKKNRPKN